VTALWSRRSRRRARLDAMSELRFVDAVEFGLRWFESHSLRNDEAPDRMNASKATSTDRMVAP
jgi:hypothetical protein